jgi:sugar O-acyltransferase (sialic acid O-acetyltransferase NeuD family)
MKKDLIVIGGGGHFRSCLDVIETQGEYQVVGIVDMPEKKGERVLGYEIIAVEDDLPGLVNDRTWFLVTIGQIKTSEPRRRVFDKLKDLGAQLPIIVSPLAHVSGHAEVGLGAIVMHHALINAGARVGQNCIINTKALVEHDAVIGDHCHVATASVINGAVQVGDNTFIGSGTITRQGVRIGSNLIIPAGERVMKDMPESGDGQ